MRSISKKFIIKFINYYIFSIAIVIAESMSSQVFSSDFKADYIHSLTGDDTKLVDIYSYKKDVSLKKSEKISIRIINQPND